MEHVRERLAASRAHTDASLGAERASTDAVGDRTAAKAQRLRDDLIERDRILADERISAFRDNADHLLASERSASRTPDRSVAIEREVADEGKKAEREVTDALLEKERQRADVAVEAERREHDAHQTGLEARRQDTDDQLSTERDGADVAVASLNDAKNALARAQNDRVRNDVLGMVAHDLRSPLCVIAMNAQGIIEITKESSTREAAEEVTRAAARMQRLLSDLLDAARIDSGTLRIVKRQQDASALVREVFHSYQPLFADRKLILTIEVPPNAVVASFDRDRVVQVLSNLLGNAMKFTPPGGEVGLHVALQAEQAEFVVRDNGPGIRPDALPHIFKRFWHLDIAARRGLGLGLYICQKIVEAHGGRICAEGEFGKGATFRFTLPAS